MSWRERIIQKINSLPEPQKTRAMQELEVHEYCGRNERKHNVLIADTPHPLMVLDGDRYSRSGQWYMGGMQ